MITEVQDARFQTKSFLELCKDFGKKAFKEEDKHERVDFLNRSKDYFEHYKEFDEKALPSIMDLIRIPNLSPSFDPEWATNGKHEKAAKILLDWALSQNVKGIKGEILKMDGLSPLIHIEIE